MRVVEVIPPEKKISEGYVYGQPRRTVRSEGERVPIRPPAWVRETGYELTPTGAKLRPPRGGYKIGETHIPYESLFGRLLFMVDSLRYDIYRYLRSSRSSSPRSGGSSSTFENIEELLRRSD